MPSRQSLDVGSLIPRVYILGPWTSSRVTYAPLVESSRRSCQTTVVLFNTETQRLQRFSSRGSPCLLWLYPWTSSLTHWTSSQFYTLRSWRLPDATVAEGDTPSLDGRNRLSPGGQLPAFARGRAQKKESTSMRLTPESGGYLLSRNSVPSAIASLTSLFGMGRGGTSLP